MRTAVSADGTTVAWEESGPADGGESDPSTPPAEAERLHREIPASRLEILAGVAHLPALERPEAVTALLEAFLG